jgi:mRNA interferase MazF
VTPERGDVVWLRLYPQAGHEQSGRRPVLVLSPRAYNDRTGLMLACPITNKAKGYQFEVPVKSSAVTGVVLADHVKSFDFRARFAEPMGQVDPDTADDVARLVSALVFGGQR